MSRICSDCEYRVETSEGGLITVTCSNTKRKHNEISYRIKRAPMWCPFLRTNRRKRKSSPRALLVKELDRLWRIAVWLQAGGVCEMTGQKDGEGKGHVLNRHHIIGKSNYRVRWMVINGALLTAGAHTLAPNSAHKNPIYFLEEMIKKRGRVWYELLQKSAYNINLPNKHSIQDLEEIREYLKGYIKNHEKDQ